MVDEGHVSADELVEAYLLELTNPWSGAAIYEWMHRETLAARKGEVVQIQALWQQLRATTDPEKRKELTARLAELEQ